MRKQWLSKVKGNFEKKKKEREKVMNINITSQSLCLLPKALVHSFLLLS